MFSKHSWVTYLLPLQEAVEKNINQCHSPSLKQLIVATGLWYYCWQKLKMSQGLTPLKVYKLNLWQRCCILVILYGIWETSLANNPWRFIHCSCIKLRYPTSTQPDFRSTCQASLWLSPHASMQPSGCNALCQPFTLTISFLTSGLISFLHQKHLSLPNFYLFQLWCHGTT